jgi:hypothetical protein
MTILIVRGEAGDRRFATGRERYAALRGAAR